MARWQQKPKPTTKQQQNAQLAQHFAHCQQGNHFLTPTFRAGEQVCTSCGIVQYYPDCVRLHHLPATRTLRAYPRPCVAHTNVEVQA